MIYIINFSDLASISAYIGGTLHKLILFAMHNVNSNWSAVCCVSSVQCASVTGLLLCWVISHSYTKIRQSSWIHRSCSQTESTRKGR